MIIFMCILYNIIYMTLWSLGMVPLGQSVHETIAWGGQYCGVELIFEECSYGFYM
jgi:hypothetical protein